MPFGFRYRWNSVAETLELLMRVPAHISLVVPCVLLVCVVVFFNRWFFFAFVGIASPRRSKRSHWKWPHRHPARAGYLKHLYGGWLGFHDQKGVSLLVRPATSGYSHDPNTRRAKQFSGSTPLIDLSWVSGVLRVVITYRITHRACGGF